MPEQFTVSPRLQAFLKRWPSRVTADVPEIQDFHDPDFPSPTTGDANKPISLYYSKSDGSYYQIFAGTSLLDNEVQVSDV